MPQQFISESCSWFHREGNYQQVLLIEKLSGIGLNRLGSFDACSADPSLRYFLMEYSIVDPQPKFYTGLCYSSNCTASDLMLIAKSVNEYIPLPFQSVNILQLQTESLSWNSYSLALVSFLGLITLLTIVGTIIQNCKLSNNQKWRKIISYFSFNSSLNYMFSESKNNERIKIVAGLRAFAFLGMTFHNLAFGLMEAPSMPQPSPLPKHLGICYFFFDLWLAISGFYLSFELFKYWSKDESIKNIIYTLFRRVVKIITVSCVAVLIFNAIVYSNKTSPLWALAYKYFEGNCHLFNIFSKCNYWLWLWSIQIQMCAISTLLFILWHSKFKLSRICYLILNVVLICLSFVLAWIYGDSNDVGNPQGSISRCPLVSGTAYLIGFNLGLLYFWFRTHRNKSRILLIRIVMYKLNRVLSSFLALSFLVLMQLYFLYLSQEVSDSVNMLIYQGFRIIVPVSYCLLILPEMIGFGNIWGVLLKDRFMNVASRLSFSTYTVYYGVCMTIVNSLQEDLHINFSKLFCLWTGSFLVSLGFGFLLCALVEIPVYRILHACLGRSNPKAYIQFY